MFEKTTPSARALALIVMCTSTLGQGCSGGPARTPAAHAEPDLLVRVVEQVFDDDWTTAGELVVERDGRYQHTIRNLSQSTPAFEKIEGHLPLALMRTLEQEVSREKAFEVVEGIPTYRYGIDDHRVRHPAGIEQLLTFVRDKDVGDEEGKSAQ